MKTGQILILIIIGTLILTVTCVGTGLGIHYHLRDESSRSTSIDKKISSSGSVTKTSTSSSNIPVNVPAKFVDTKFYACAFPPIIDPRAGLTKIPLPERIKLSTQECKTSFTTGGQCLPIIENSGNLMYLDYNQKIFVNSKNNFSCTNTIFEFDASNSTPFVYIVTTEVREVIFALFFRGTVLNYPIVDDPISPAFSIFVNGNPINPSCLKQSANANVSLFGRQSLSYPVIPTQLFANTESIVLSSLCDSNGVPIDDPDRQVMFKKGDVIQFVPNIQKLFVHRFILGLKSLSFGLTN